MTYSTGNWLLLACATTYLIGMNQSNTSDLLSENHETNDVTLGMDYVDCHCLASYILQDIPHAKCMSSLHLPHLPTVTPVMDSTISTFSGDLW